MGTTFVLVAGVLAAAIGGELFVRGAVGLAAWARVPASIIAVTVAAFATSSPELFVTVNAATDGAPEIGFGDALGSNVVNIALVLGLALLVRPARVERDAVRRDLPVALAVPALTVVLALDGSMSRLDGGLLLATFFTWLGVTARSAHRARRDSLDETDDALDETVDAVLGERNRHRILAEMLGGLVLLVVAGRLIVIAAETIGEALGLDAFVVGATFVAIGTSMPELATTIAAGLRGHQEIGIGAILGSNIFNGLWIVSVAALLSPFDVALDEVLLSLVVGALALVMLIPGRRLFLARWRGAALLAVYAGYLVVLLAVRPGT
ncbi:calcium/sodium antiporter [Rhabdothermincola salaria]|uniref:calcium/sodium antiporter n=1 Tax=Rhabdothermincola salaria TaxID=2903142 RepID=UPI001E4B866B|nr:calcium/sodium antiporter [Rhabdothermincola salaria]MCD9622240.1 calcium/sodium antiporter [Rhabdothermincola salaria]